VPLSFKNGVFVVLYLQPVTSLVCVQNTQVSCRGVTISISSMELTAQRLAKGQEVCVRVKNQPSTLNP